MSKKTSSKKTSSKKTSSKKTATDTKFKPRAERIADAVARRTEGLDVTERRQAAMAVKLDVVSDASDKTASVSAMAESLIKDGATNEAVLAALVFKHGLDPVAKRHYPGWYRARLVRKGVITKQFANEHRHEAGA